LLSSPFIFAWSGNSLASDAVLARLYPARSIIYYYPDQSDILYSKPRWSRLSYKKQPLLMLQAAGARLG
jgi:hypothetical protein